MIVVKGRGIFAKACSSKVRDIAKAIRIKLMTKRESLYLTWDKRIED